MRVIFLILAFAAILIHGEYNISTSNHTTLSPDNQTTWTNYNLPGRIVNGTKAALRQFPYQVSLRRSYNFNHFCGASLIDQYFVLTAAHCMFANGNQIQAWTIVVVAGQLELSEQASTSQKRGVDKIYIHPQFDSSTLQNDVAILVLKVPFKLTPEVNVGKLPTADVATNTVCQVAGWGYPDEDYPVVTEHLMFVDLPVLSQDTCRKLLENVTDLPPGMFCAGYLEGQRDACKGDSGSGMICDGILSGVVSGGMGCARPAMPGVYSNVYYFKDWIRTTTKISTTAEARHGGSQTILSSTLLSTALFFILFHV